MKKIQYKSENDNKIRDAFILFEQTEIDGEGRHIGLIYSPRLKDDDFGILEFAEKKRKYWYPLVDNSLGAFLQLENQGQLDDICQALGEVDFKL